ncbi:hypothetical protein VP01_1318g3 [Puccinia sorghi]|uniref:Uncharacterized protein n=1 Tax=Puccinia sorghi TaxID=27349 RepID=A0A0L6VMR9_9BASI|nr:hypothetical protein VP01_1318g3 [Puccinia sorghi]
MEFELNDELCPAELPDMKLLPPRIHRRNAFQESRWGLGLHRHPGGLRGRSMRLERIACWRIGFCSGMCWRKLLGLDEGKKAGQDADEEKTGLKSCFYYPPGAASSSKAGCMSAGTYSISLNDTSKSLRSLWSGISPQIYSELEFRTRVVENTLIIISPRCVIARATKRREDLRLPCQPRGCDLIVEGKAFSFPDRTDAYSKRLKIHVAQEVPPSDVVNKQGSAGECAVWCRSCFVFFFALFSCQPYDCRAHAAHCGLRQEAFPVSSRWMCLHDLIVLCKCFVRSWRFLTTDSDQLEPIIIIYVNISLFFATHNFDSDGEKVMMKGEAPGLTKIIINHVFLHVISTWVSVFDLGPCPRYKSEGGVNKYMHDEKGMPKLELFESHRGVRINTKEKGRLLHHRKDISSSVIKSENYQRNEANDWLFVYRSKLTLVGFFASASLVKKPP